MDISRSTESIKRLWGGLSGLQRLVLATAAVLLVGLLTWGSKTAAADDWQKVVGHEVDNDARAAALKALAQKRIAYDVRGGEVYVRKAEADKVVLELAGEGALSNQAMWKWLEHADVFATKWDKEKRFQIALQRKLEYMIGKIEGVRSASVQITPASESQQLGFQGPKASASVQVELKPGATLSYANVRAIAGVVAHAVPGLDPDRVLLTDTQARPYRIPKVDEFAAGAGDIREIEARLEAEIKAKIAELFEGARIVVRAVARTTSQRTESVKHGARPVTVYEKQRTVIKDPGKAAETDGIKGAQEPAPPAAARASEKEFELKHVVDVTNMTVHDPAGVIERITVGVLLPKPVDAKGHPVGALPPLEEVRKLAMMASGAKLEDVTVVALETRAPEPIPAEPPAERAVEWLSANWTKIALAALAFFALVVAVLLARGATQKGEVEEIRAIATRLGEPLRAAAADPLRPAEGDIASLRRGIQEAVERNPEEAAEALKDWVAGR